MVGTLLLAQSLFAMLLRCGCVLAWLPWGQKSTHGAKIGDLEKFVLLVLLHMMYGGRWHLAV